MRLSLILISLIFNSSIISGQIVKNKSVLSSWDSLYMRHEQALNFYNNYIDSVLFKSDTLTTKDSIVISKFSKDSLILQKIIKSPRMVDYGNDSHKCIEDIREEFYNPRGFIAYTRNYHQSCSIIIDSQNEKIFSVVYYERYKYDEDDNLIIRVFNLSTPMTIKETHKIENGKWTQKRQKINETDFWK